jgi:opacity protein-like surface antigen
MRRAVALLRALAIMTGFAGLAAALPSAGHATEFVLLPGLTYSSPRTSLRDPFSFVGLTAGFGFDFAIRDNAHVMTDVEYAVRRFGGFSSIPTLLWPTFGRYVGKILILGVGPYFGIPLGVSSDDGRPSDLDNMSWFEFGLAFEGGFKLPLTRRVTVTLTGRFERALTAAYSNATDTFYWTQFQGFIGFQFKVGKAARQFSRY